LFDFVVGVIALIVSSPVMLAVALIIKVTSPGPVLFSQIRVGKDGQLFRLMKFRTMTNRAEQSGPGVTQAGDQRITAAGRVLRKWKLDELPQMFHVVYGDMSLVGPRPDLPEYLEQLPPALNRLVCLRPGITGAATLRLRNEEELLASVPASDLRRYYIFELMPQKATHDLNYAGCATFRSDIALLIKTVAAILPSVQL